MVESILSKESLGAVHTDFQKKSYQRNGIHVTPLVGQRRDRSKRYTICTVHPVKGWYPSKTANFVFKSKDFDPQYLMRLSADMAWNPSVWIHSKSGRFVVRVPKDRGQDVWKRLYRRGLWYNPATNLWHKRRKKSRKSGYPSFIQSLGLQKKYEKIQTYKEEEVKPLSVKIRRKR